jgi:superfamily II DNA or RNA helicase
MPKAQHPKAASFVRQNLFAGVTTFAELEARISALPDEQSRGNAFEVFAEAYLATQRKHDAANVWPLTSVPTQILQRLGLATQDCGVDGVFQTLLGNFNAYQVKFRTSRPALTWRELSTFMGLADSPHIRSRVLLTNCDELSSVLNERAGCFCIRGSDLDRMEVDDFRVIEAWLADAAYIPPKKTPQPHQAEALDAILPALQTHDRVSAIMACGTGKTLLALWVMERLEAKRVLVLLPSLALLRQTLHEWLHETCLPSLAYICVCSDPTVKEGIDTLSTQQSDLDFPVSTGAVSVRSFLGVPFAGVKLVFSTYQSASVVGLAMQPGEAFDFAVFDEAHKTAGREGRNFAFALADTNLSIRKRLFLTATPRHYNPLTKDEEGDAALVFSMDKPNVYGPQAYRLTFAEAARRGIICGYKVIISVITSEMVTNELLSRGEVVVNGDAVRARQVANQLALKDVVVKYKLNKVFTFHSRIDAASSFASDGNEGISTHLPEFKAFHVNGEMPTSFRERVMTAFRGCARGVMSNARCLTEGVDVPAVDMVAFMSPRRSKIDIVQATGRAMRTAPGKTMGFVLVPLYVEQASGETIAQAIERTEFDEVWQVLQSLQEQDDVLAETISQLRECRGRGVGFDDANFRGQVDILGPKICLEVLPSAITTKCADALGSTWDERLGQLKAFQERVGHLHVDTNWQLIQWVRLQRRLKWNGRLPDDRVQRLNAIGFNWNLTKGQRNWDIMFAKLCAFKKLHGHCNLKEQPAGHYILQSWLDDQSRLFARNRLAADRIEQLKQLGVVFAVVEKGNLTTGQKNWNIMFAELCAFKKLHGHCNLKEQPAGHYILQSWLDDQSRLFARNRLAAERIRRLDEIGFVWDRKDDLWQTMYSATSQHLVSAGVSGLESYLQINGEPNRELRKWVKAQQSAKKRGVLSSRQQSALDKIGFPWQFPKIPKESTKPSWESLFMKLVEFHKMHGHCDMKLVLPLDAHLHKWAQVQRQAKESGMLTDAQVHQLDQIGFIWHTDDLLWERMFKALITYKSAHGDCNVPLYSQLSVWGTSQRKKRAKGSLRKERVERLESLGFGW